MAILAFDTSSKVCTVALGTAEKILVEFSLNLDYTHSDYLMTLIEQALDTAKLSGKDIEAIGVSVGPGSFTGLRIGLAIAKGLALSWNCDIYPFTSLEILAAGVWGSSDPVLALISAQRGEVYAGLFSTGRGRPHLEHPYFIGRTSHEVRDLLINYENVRVVGNGVVQYLEQMRDICQVMPTNPVYDIPRAGVIIVLTANALNRAEQPADIRSLEPFYMRISAAEQNRLAKEQGNEK